MKPRFFATPQDFRAWFEAHHSTVQALCFGWIDGVRRGIDDASYTIRFTPRRPASTWSAKNIARVAELTEVGLMHPAGLAAFECRTEARSGVYSFEQETIELGAFERRFRADRGAWAFFQAQPPSYRKAATWWVISAKKEETRLRRLATLIDDSANGRRLKGATRRPPA